MLDKLACKPGNRQLKYNLAGHKQFDCSRSGSMYRPCSRILQHQDLGQKSWWMSWPVGRVLFWGPLLASHWRASI